MNDRVGKVDQTSLPKNCWECVYNIYEVMEQAVYCPKLDVLIVEGDSKSTRHSDCPLEREG